METVHDRKLNRQHLVQLQKHSRQLNNILPERQSPFLGTEIVMDRSKMSKPETRNLLHIHKTYLNVNSTTVKRQLAQQTAAHEPTQYRNTVRSLSAKNIP